MGMSFQFPKSFVVIMMGTILPGTWSTSFLKSAIRRAAVGPQQEPEEGLDDLKGSCKHCVAVVPLQHGSGEMLPGKSRCV